MITIVEPFLGTIVSGLLKRGFAENWSKEHGIGFALEVIVDYIILVFLVYLATQHGGTALKYGFWGVEIEMPKGAWTAAFFVIVILATLFWKMARKQVMATVKLKSQPAWGYCLLYCLPNLAFMYITTHFIFNLGHVDKWRTQSRIDVMSMKPR